jgi:cell division septation protein DedD
MQRAAAQGLPQAAVNLQQMDKHIALPQRQQGLALARQMEQKAPSPEARPAQSSGAIRPATVPPSNSAIQSTVAAPAPGRAPARVAATPAPAGAGRGWKVQLGAFGNAANARRHWDSVRGKVGALGALSPSFEPAGAMTRLKAGPVGDRAAADRICAAARAAGSACFPVAR